MRFLLIIRSGQKCSKVEASNRSTAQDVAWFWRAAGFKVRIFDRWS